MAQFTHRWQRKECFQTPFMEISVDIKLVKKNPDHFFN